MIRITANDVSRAVHDAFIMAEVASNPAMFSQISRAATGAVRDAGDLMKQLVRANIGAAGFSSKWQNAFRVNNYPQRGFSVQAAAFGFHKIPYAEVFESGATIRGAKGLLWLPLPTVPKKGQRRARPRDLAQAGVKMFSIQRPGKAPLLATSLRLTNSARGKISKVAASLGKLRRGTAGKNGTVSTVPLFFGVQSVTLRKRFDVKGAAREATARLPDFYLRRVGAQ